ncbi:response regulator [Paenibacillus rigui]|uniref:Two-component system response regulator n=1 Tax=Paenibacillus rigui TaxID=554312 RepID=A0A229UVR8_9BACL|nr:response regulator [Paenibacillus rigui]OXM87687.1 two-component system response regulator [Paenibacillus rigui]
MSKVLIVDDAAFMRNIIRDILEAEGHVVIGEASNGKDAILLYRQLKPDMVTMDITMPGMDGIAAMKEIKKKDSRAKVIICSALGEQPTVVEAIKAGAIDFLVKPFQKERVLSAISKI